MTKEELKNIIDNCPNYFKGSELLCYVIETALRNEDNYFALDVYDMVHKKLYSHMMNTIHYSNIINERATYLESYLAHEMFDEESEYYKEHEEELRAIQKEHANIIKLLSHDIAKNDTKSNDIPMYRNIMNEPVINAIFNE